MCRSHAAPARLVSPGVLLASLLLALPGFGMGAESDPGFDVKVPGVGSSGPVAGEAVSGMAGAAFVEAPPCEGDGVVAKVVALSGAAHAQAPGEDPRALACDDVVHACETVITSAGARVGLLAQDIYAQVDVDTRLRVGERAGLPDFWLAAGGVRIIDPRGVDAAPVRVSTPHGAAEGAGIDTEIWTRVPRGTESTRVCSHEVPVELRAIRGGTSSAAGACADVFAGGVTPLASQSPRIAVAEPLACDFDVAIDLTPTDVASPPIGLAAFPSVRPADALRRNPCDNPGSGCGGRVTPPPPPVVPPRPVPPSPTRRFLQQPPSQQPGGPGNILVLD